jgi:nucleoside-diphosphate-sugar epimerase
MDQNRENTSTENPVVLVTGGSGFLGQNIVNELLEPGSVIKAKEIRVLDIKAFEGKNKDQVRFYLGDIQNYDHVNEACIGVDLVIHSAAIIDWGTKEEQEVLSINFGGTENIIRACQENNVANLIYTSSLDAVYTGKALVDIDEDQEYPIKPINSYCKSKFLSEKRVIEANGSALKTCILRPSDIYGEADPYHIDSLIDMAKSGFYIRLGNGKSKCQHVYVGNMAHAHVLAGSAMLQDNENILGKVYFITDGPAVNFFSFFDQIVLDAGHKIWPKNLWLARWLAYPLASLTEFGAYLFRPIKRVDVKFSRFAVAYTCTDFTFSSEKAKNDFNYHPKYSIEEGIKRTAHYYKNT